MHPDLHDALQLFWADHPLVVSQHGATVAEALEARYNISLPDDFKAYLIEASPHEDWDHENGFTLWEPARVKSIEDECKDLSFNGTTPKINMNGDCYLVFADWISWCYAYAICCAEGPDRGKVAIIGTRSERWVARSFCSFLKLAAEDSDRLHSPAGDHFTDII